MCMPRLVERLWVFDCCSSLSQKRYKHSKTCHCSFIFLVQIVEQEEGRKCLMSTWGTPQVFEVVVEMPTLVYPWHHSTPLPRKANLACLWPSRGMFLWQFCMHRLRGFQGVLTHLLPGLSDHKRWSELLLLPKWLSKSSMTLVALVPGISANHQSIFQALDGPIEERDLGANIAQLRMADFEKSLPNFLRKHTVPVISITA